MAEHIYLCQQCQNVFKLSVSNGLPLEKEATCPVCGSSHLEEVPSWVPIGFNQSEGTPLWEYECQHCQNLFKLPVPGSPSQEKEVRCPACGGSHIHRLTPTGFEPLYCG